MNENVKKMLKKVFVINVLFLAVLAAHGLGAGKIKVLSIEDLKEVGGTCHIGECDSKALRTECDNSKSNTRCTDFTESADCCFFVNYRWNVYECTDTDTGIKECWSYGDVNCYSWKPCVWDGSSCYYDGGSCRFEKKDKQDCLEPTP